MFISQYIPSFKSILFISIFLLIVFFMSAQIIPSERKVDWTIAGLRDTSTIGFENINVVDSGLVPDGITANDEALEILISSIPENGATLYFPTGDYVFNHTIDLPSNVLIKGAGAEHTNFLMDLEGTGDCFLIKGGSVPLDTTYFVTTANKGDDFILVNDPISYNEGDWLHLKQYDTDWVTSSWGEETVGQIIRINNIEGNKIYLNSPLRMTYDIGRTPYIQKIIPKKNVGIECLKIKRFDNTSPSQTNNVHFNFAVNCWVKGIESENSNFAHVTANKSSNILISHSYFHHGFEYGGGGRAYGVMLHLTSNECRVENNIFEHLRHAMIVQAGANGNVFAYNYSLDPFWTNEDPFIPEDGAGDIVLHGNYVYANLFESNICRNIIIDNSHGPNGPYNTFFRNRAEGYGMIFMEENSPSQNLIANEITNTNLPYSLVNYTIKGEDHFLHGNNDKGIIKPEGTENLSDISYAYSSPPDFVPENQWAGIGTPNIMEENKIPARDRYQGEQIFSGSCGYPEYSAPTPTNEIDLSDEQKIKTFPNPTSSAFLIQSENPMRSIRIIDAMGRIIFLEEGILYKKEINTSQWTNGFYIIEIKLNNGIQKIEKLLKMN